MQLDRTAVSRRTALRGLASAATALAVGGCAGDMGAATSQKSGGGGQLRYYGGPKSPMWSSQ